MNIQYYILIGLILLCSFIHAQPDSSRIKVIVNELHSEHLTQEVTVHFFTKNDTIIKGETDSLGKFEFMYLILPEEKYFLSTQLENSHYLNEVITIVGDSTNVNDYTIEISLKGSCKLNRRGIIAYYEENETKKTDFDFDILLDLMSEYPQMCLKALPFYTLAENELISDERIMRFKNRLIEEGVDIDRVLFKSAKIINNQFDEENYKPHIYFEVIRIDGGCN